MKTTLVLLCLLFVSYSSKAQKTIGDYLPNYPLQDVKESYDENLNLVYQLKLSNKSKKDITTIAFSLEPTWLSGDTQLMTTLRADKTITIKRNISVKAGQTVYYNLDTPSNKYAVSVLLVRYSDETFKKY